MNTTKATCSPALYAASMGVKAINRNRDLGLKVDQKSYERLVGKMLNLYFREQPKISN